MAEKSVCKIENCNKRHLARGWCKMHYQRWKRNGNPIAGRTPAGDLDRYFRQVVLAYEGDECLTWPYARATNGYGHLKRDGRTYSVHRLVCIEVNGPPPSQEHDAAHACGNGHLACCTKRHLSWKTPKENEADKLLHDTHQRGERNPQSKLTTDAVLAIRALHGHRTQILIAQQFNISQNCVSQIIRRVAWSWLE